MVIAEILDSGNFVVRYSNNTKPDEYLWQSFNFPTDTLIPGMELLLDPRRTHMNKYLISWKTLEDTAPGDYVFKFETDFSVLSTWNKYIPYYRSGPWNGTKFINAPTVFKLTRSRELKTLSLSIAPSSISPFSRLRIEFNGRTILHVWNKRTSTWDSSWSSTDDICYLHNTCGSNAYCDQNITSPCTCLQGFESFDQTFVTANCVRQTPFNCSGNDGFTELTNVNLPDMSNAWSYNSITTGRDCRKMCLSKCNCTAFALAVPNNNDFGNGGPICINWQNELTDVKRFPFEGQNLCLRVAGDSNASRGLVLGLSIGLPALVLIVIFFATFWFWKRIRNTAIAAEAAETAAAAAEAVETTAAEAVAAASMANYRDSIPTETLTTGEMIDFGIVQRATQNFAEANKIGHGGFSVVYKGVLEDGRQIAVKKLMEIPYDVTTEFENEVVVIASLQHINIVRLIGWSAHGVEKVLIYDFLENGTLESYLSGKAENSVTTPNWQTRFDIINGITRGIKYLHEESHLKVVHRDIKSANVLLDRDMVPKISDFGMARIFARSQNQAFTTRIGGTFGYIPPECAGLGIVSPKFDVYSLGVVILEVVRGKTNSRFFSEYHTNLVTHAWLKWDEGYWQETVDPIILVVSPSLELIRCIQVALLCVQEDPFDRPTMSQVVAMLGNVTTEIPQPKMPGYYTIPYPASSSSNDESSMGDDNSN